MLFFQILPVWVFIFAMELMGKSNERASKSFEIMKGYEMFVHYQPNPCGRSVGDCAVRAISAAVEEYNNVTSTAIIKVPAGCCFSISVRSVAASDDPTATPAPVIEVQNANFVVSRIA